MSRAVFKLWATASLLWLIVIVALFGASSPEGIAPLGLGPPLLALLVIWLIGLID